MTKNVLLVDGYNTSPNPHKKLIERKTKGEIEVTCAKNYNDAFNEAVSGKYNPIVMVPGLGMEGADIDAEDKKILCEDERVSAVNVYLKNQIVKYFNEVSQAEPPAFIFLEAPFSQLSDFDKKDIAECVQIPTTNPMVLVEAVQRHI